MTQSADKLLVAAAVPEAAQPADAAPEMPENEQESIDQGSQMEVDGELGTEGVVDGQGRADDSEERDITEMEIDSE